MHAAQVEFHASAEDEGVGRLIGSSTAGLDGTDTLTKGAVSNPVTSRLGSFCCKTRSWGPPRGSGTACPYSSMGGIVFGLSGVTGVFAASSAVLLLTALIILAGIRLRPAATMA
jgi:hypothetical protein